MRPIHSIAKDIYKDWLNVNYAAKPYLNAMMSISNINDKYYDDTAKSVVLYFLSNASSWRGDVAKRIKQELKDMCK